MLDLNKIGQLIKELRQKKHYTQSDLGNIVHVSDRAVSKWENGKSLPDVEVLQLLSQEFGIPVDNLLRGEKPKKAHFPYVLIYTIIQCILVAIPFIPSGGYVDAKARLFYDFDDYFVQYYGFLDSKFILMTLLSILSFLCIGLIIFNCKLLFLRPCLFLVLVIGQIVIYFIYFVFSYLFFIALSLLVIQIVLLSILLYRRLKMRKQK